MLNIIITDKFFQNTIFAIDGYFDSAWEPEWIDNDFARMVIKDIDKSDVISSRIIRSPFLGNIDPTWLSGGVKCLLCLMFGNVDKWIFDITVCGNNCANWIQYIGENKNITVQLAYMMHFFDRSKDPIRIVNSGCLVSSQMEFIGEYLKYLV